MSFHVYTADRPPDTLKDIYTVRQSFQEPDYEDRSALMSLLGGTQGDDAIRLQITTDPPEQYLDFTVQFGDPDLVCIVGCMTLERGATPEVDRRFMEYWIDRLEIFPAFVAATEESKKHIRTFISQLDQHFQICHQLQGTRAVHRIKDSEKR